MRKRTPESIPLTDLIQDDENANRGTQRGREAVKRSLEGLGTAYKAIGKRVRTYPAHPVLIRSFNKGAKNWMLLKPSQPVRGQESKQQ